MKTARERGQYVSDMYRERVTRADGSIAPISWTDLVTDIAYEIEEACAEKAADLEAALAEVSRCRHCGGDLTWGGA